MVSAASFSCLGAGTGGGVESAERFNQWHILLKELSWGGVRDRSSWLSMRRVIVKTDQAKVQTLSNKMNKNRGLMYNMVTAVINTVLYT